MVDFKGLQFRDSKSALGVVAANIPSTSVGRPSPSLRVWTMVYVRTETAARNSRPAVSQDIRECSYDFCNHSVV